jgi:hypothetical protein
MSNPPPLTGDNTQAEKLFQENKNFKGHGFCLVQMYDTKGKKATIIKCKVQGEELILLFDASNEEDVTTQFKLKRATKEFCKAVCDRVNIVFRDGALKIDFNWDGIHRIQIEAELRALKLAETKRHNEEVRIQKEKEKEEARIAEEKRKAEEEKKRIEKERREREAEEFRKKEAEKKAKEEAANKFKAFADKISKAQLDGGVMKVKEKHADEQDYGALPHNITKTFSEEAHAFYYYDEETNEVSWRDPRIQSVWEKLWSVEQNRFYYSNKQTKETKWEAPWEARFDQVWIPDKNHFVWVNKETGDVQDMEPYY